LYIFLFKNIFTPRIQASKHLPSCEAYIANFFVLFLVGLFFYFPSRSFHYANSQRVRGDTVNFAPNAVVESLKENLDCA
jgi:hypothetical protein